MTVQDAIPTHLRRMYPESGAGGFSHVNTTIEFYTRVNALLPADAVMVDLGAGRGQFLEDTNEFRRSLRSFKGRVSRLIGLDVDEAVLSNAAMDEAHVTVPGQRYPVATGSVDVIVSDWTLEHVADPSHTAAEISRIMRPGGWFCARTPNRWGYIGIAARIVPNKLHDHVLRHAQPRKQARDTFPTQYALNSERQLRQHFPLGRWEHFSYAVNGEPAYFGSSLILNKMAGAMISLTPTANRAVLHVFVRKIKD
ncbi:MAG: methyltransferase domain-containing protein [Sporichthyaceae bacterium]